MSRVRTATRSDIPTLTEWAKSFHSISPYKDHPLDLSVTADWLRALIHLPKHTILMTETGAIGGFIAPVARLNLNILQEEFWFVSKPMDGPRLFDAFKQWGRQEGADHISMASIPGGEKVEAFYARQGLVKTEVRYVGGL